MSNHKMMWYFSPFSQGEAKKVSDDSYLTIYSMRYYNSGKYYCVAYRKNIRTSPVRNYDGYDFVRIDDVTRAYVKGIEVLIEGTFG